jgi:transcriptional regulator GlxA family with amidase domain
MAPVNFNRAFKSVFGTTPAEFVENLRLNEAQRRLLSPRKTLESIAQSVGFSNAKGFRAHLKDGTTPGIYLNNFDSRLMRACSN